MFRVLGDNEGRHRIESDDGAAIGFVRGRYINISGLAGESAAIRAAVPAARALEAVLRREYAGWPRYEPRLDALRLVHDGAYEWVSDGTAPIARLVRPRSNASERYGLEFVLPSFASEGFGVTAALAIAHALAPHLGLSVPPLAAVDVATATA
jgi:hypothetical protein